MSAETILSAEATAAVPPPPPIEADATAARSSEMRGLIDNATADRLYGWVWDVAHPGYRVTVELRLAGEVVATTIADYARPDLAKNGVGDGCHAFEFPLLRQWSSQPRDLTAVAYGKDGVEFLMPVRIHRNDDASVPAKATVQLQATTKALLAEHQSVRQEIEALRLRSAQLPDIAAIEAVTKAGQDLQRRIDSLELWITRLDSKLADVVPGRPEKHTRLDPWQALLIVVLVGAMSAVATFMLTRPGI
jgi:hypothetical protein